ncbi:hypothetical protein B0H16DRAFT_1453787 [Mycena metata]|uniref:Uncharacterized protein n=1 Tax=Mycena metata TaxID=1033252 RepID=A0AAD7JN13_9AGAR|nr:hypothetical protein B0H16DRAFT_1453787 [Mycena metata]
MLSQPQPPSEPEGWGSLHAPATATQFLAVATSKKVSNKRGLDEPDEAPTGKKARSQAAWCPQCHNSFASTRSRNKHVGIPCCIDLANRRGLPTKTFEEWEERKSSFRSETLVHLRESSEAFEDGRKPVARPSGHGVPVAEFFSVRAPSDAAVMPPIPVVQQSTSVSSVEQNQLWGEKRRMIMSEFRSTQKLPMYPMPPQAQLPLQTSGSFGPSDLGGSYATTTASGSGVKSYESTPLPIYPMPPQAQLPLQTSGSFGPSDLDGSYTTPTVSGSRVASYDRHAGTQSSVAWYSDIYAIEDHPAYIPYDPQLEQPPPQLDVEEAWPNDAAYAQMPMQSEDWSQWDPSAFQFEIAETATTAPNQFYYSSHMPGLPVPLSPYPSTSTPSHNYPEPLHPVSVPIHHPSSLTASGDGSKEAYPQPDIKTPPALRRSRKHRRVRSIPTAPALAAEACSFEAAPRPGRYPREGVSTPAAIDHAWNVYGPSDGGMRQIRTPRYPKRDEKEVESEEQSEESDEGVGASHSSSGSGKGGADIPEVLEESTDVVEVTSTPVEALEILRSSKTSEAMRVGHEEGKESSPAETLPACSRGDEQSSSLPSDEEDDTLGATLSGAYWGTPELTDSSTPSTVDPDTPSDGLEFRFVDFRFVECGEEASSEETPV